MKSFEELLAFQKRQEEFNQALLERLEKRDENLMAVFGKYKRRKRNWLQVNKRNGGCFGEDNKKSRAKNHPTYVLSLYL